jgi:hypothetical protein
MKPRLALNSLFSCLRLISAGITAPGLARDPSLVVVENSRWFFHMETVGSSMWKWILLLDIPQFIQSAVEGQMLALYAV